MLARSEGAEETTTEKAKPSDVSKAITKTKFTKLLKNQIVRAGEMDEIRSAMGGEMSTAVEKDHLDKAMFSIVKRLKKMPPEKLAHHLPNLMLYIEYAELEKIAASAPRLDLNASGEDEDEEE